MSKPNEFNAAEFTKGAVEIGEPVNATLVVPAGETEADVMRQLREWAAAKAAARKERGANK